MANLEAESQVSGEVGSLGRHKKTSPSTKDCVTKGTQKRNNVAFWGESHVISLLINGILVILFLELVTYNFATISEKFHWSFKSYLGLAAKTSPDTVELFMAVSPS